MIEDYEQNDYLLSYENNRYNKKDKEEHFQKEPNRLDYSSINTNEYNYYNNNYNNYSQNINSNNNYNSINPAYSQNSIITEKREETMNSINQQSKTIDSLNNKYFSKVIVENIRQPKDIIYILDNFLTENNYPKNYETNLEKKKVSFIFYDEDIAFNFTKLLNGIKNRNVLYVEMNVHLSLTPNNNYNKINDGKMKKRGLSIDSIQRLFNGLGSKKQEKKNKINPNLDLGVSSPFSYPYEKKRHKKIKNNKDHSMSNEKLKDYNKLPIRVLDTDYIPLQSPIFRREAKDKWISPTNFKF
jgi:hypothetical protein